MKKGLKRALVILLVFAAAIGLSAAASRVIWHRSLMASAVELYLRIAWGNRDMTAEEAEAILEEKRQAGDEAYVVPKMRFKSGFGETELNGSKLLIFTGSDSPERIVIYLHGGAYVNQMTRFHLRFCDKLAAGANARVIAPIYPLAPNHTYADAYALIEALYERELASGLPVTLMGDSAGGGLAAAFAEKLVSDGKAAPDSLVLLSPWVDVSMSGDYSALEKVDPMLGTARLKHFGESWAGGLSAKDPLISPLFGSAEGLPKTLIFAGTREIFYYDLIRFYDMLSEAGVDTTLVIGEGMDHVYPLYPIPEAKKSLRQILDFLSE